MTDPWSVHCTKNETIQENPINEQELQLDNLLVFARNESQGFGFEDSFIQNNNNSDTLEDTAVKHTLAESQNNQHKPLPDSEIYLKGLERKLEKLKKSSKLVDALSEKRNDCMRSMLQDNSSNSGFSNDILLELEESLTNSDSAVQHLYRQIQPVRPVTVGETVHILKYDQLEEQSLEQEKSEIADEQNDLSKSR